MRTLKGMRILVTGASSGIGRATALRLAELGAIVVAAGRDAERLSALQSDLTGQDHACVAGSLDDADQVAAWMKDLSGRHGPFDGVFHAAGIELIRPIKLTKQSHLDELFSSSLHAAFGIARAAGQQGVMADGGSILFMSSVAGTSGQVGMSAYAAAKAGIEGLTRCLACEVAPRRIRANALAAGAVETPMHSRIARGAGEAGLDAYRSSHLLGFGTPEDIAAAAVFLLGPDSRWITGTTLVVDGGYQCR